MTNEQQTPRTLVQQLQARQSELQINQTQAAQQCGVSRAVYSRWVNDLALPSPANIGGVAEFLGMKPSDVVRLFPDEHRSRYAVPDALTAVRAELAALRSRVETNERTDAEFRADIASLRTLVQRMSAAISAATPTG